MNHFIYLSGMSRAAAWGIIRMAFVVSAALSLSAPSALGFGDGTVGDREIAFQYLDHVENAVGFEQFDSVSPSLCSRLALTLGRLDRDWLTPEAFIQHVRQVEAARSRFYKKKKLTEDEVAAYLLPYRIRYELTSKPGWLSTLARHFAPVASDATAADEAALAILAWISAHVKLLDPAVSYPMPQRGDLDPLSVLKGGYGNELDCAIFGVAALRASGVAARFVWVPTLRGGKGGKAWLEYLNEAGNWVPWVPSFESVADHAAEIRKRIGPGILFVMARPEAPIEITNSYVDTVEIIVDSSEKNLEVQFLALGEDRLMPARGQENMRNERRASIGRGSVVIAASFGMRSFALLPVECGPDQDRIHIKAEAGGLALAAAADSPTALNPSPPTTD